MQLSCLTSSLAVVTNRTDGGISVCTADLMCANTLLSFSLKYVCAELRTYVHTCSYMLKCGIA